MDELFQAKIDNIVKEMTNVIANQNIDISTARALMAVAINRFGLLMTHIGYLESKVENLTAENQRMSQISRY